MNIRLIIFPLLLCANSIFAQVMIYTDTIPYSQEYEVFYETSLNLIQQIKESENLNKELIENLNAKNENRNNLKRRITFAKESFAKESPSSKEKCIYTISRFTEDGNVSRIIVDVNFQYEEGVVVIFSYEFETKQLITFLMFKKMGQSDVEKSMREMNKRTKE
tara:strand:- start:80 stop:568 length:489 start_codon:yes stop_codon:yes gene_type:complete